MIERLGLGGRVKLKGFVDNPYPYVAAADLFVLSSRWEGSPNVLVEALALGTPVVSTDCPSGSGEILGPALQRALVPVGDPTAMARAIPRHSTIRRGSMICAGVWGASRSRAVPAVILKPLVCRSRGLLQPPPVASESAHRRVPGCLVCFLTTVKGGPKKA